MNTFFKFEIEEALKPVKVLGLTNFEQFITADEEQNLISMIDNEEWQTWLLRKVQHYGTTYSYFGKNDTLKVQTRDIPPWLANLVCKVHSTGLLKQMPNQVIINEYMPGQGIGAHIDCPIQFGDTVCSLSLGDSYVMTFENPDIHSKLDLFLERRSLLILNEEARFTWTHKISPRKTDIVDGYKKARSRRISITFRTRKEI